ncbi:TlpA disulfide reductase family protein [Hydrogenophaga sp.]|uniref:TlpA disulfide reductase family protein n=1 Tax=Hydrogenophaga sp. TaxID=1904254 RepID=UPI001991F5EB|nr:TlpA disulfide reductase family protein [Hydrogenophaga sp.]MBD3894169.1 TlpA family protein disulfide reductase [Hydrogenophaga sp.]
MRRRTCWMAAVAGAATLAGAGAAWWRYRPAPLHDAAQQTFWRSQFEGPNGELLQLADWRGRPLLLNFWATWCPPCVEELPLLNAFYRAHAARGWQVLGLAVDQPAAVRSFTQKLPLDFPVGVAGLAGIELSRALGNASGALPFTVVFSASGAVLHRKVGKVSQSDLNEWAQGG